VAEPEAPKPIPKKDWRLTADSFQRLLKSLDEGEESGGRNYEEMRRKLVQYFDRKNCLDPEELADEALNRVARRLEEQGSIIGITLEHYCYIVATYVFRESRRKPEHVSLGDLPVSAQPALNAEPEEKERRLNCLERCAQKLKPEEYKLIIQFYQDEEGVKIENRRRLAEALGISSATLNVRAHRIRGKLEPCVEKCLRH